MYSTHTCGALSIQDTGKTVTLAGWVQTIRKFGAITFIDLRDRYGVGDRQTVRILPVVESVPAVGGEQLDLATAGFGVEAQPGWRIA